MELYPNVAEGVPEKPASAARSDSGTSESSVLNTEPSATLELCCTRSGRGAAEWGQHVVESSWVVVVQGCAQRQIITVGAARSRWGEARRGGERPTGSVVPTVRSAMGLALSSS